MAWTESRGPRRWSDAALLGLKGFCMGAADIIPGVSGGTIAFITGIYADLLAAIASFDSTAVRRAMRLDLKGVLAHAHVRFLVSLLVGIGAAILSMARLMHYLIQQHPVPTWALFFGLIAASVLFIGREVTDWRWGVPLLVLGAAVAYVLVGMIPRQTPDALWFVTLCGAIAICAMILPGVSGSFLLLILGKYELVIGAVKAPFASLEHVLILGAFALGALVGICAFSRLLKYALAHWHNATMCVLMGLMIGGLRKVWPWKDVVRRAVIEGRERIVESRNVLPDAVDREFVLALVLMVLGFACVFLLERMAGSPCEANAESAEETPGH